MDKKKLIKTIVIIVIVLALFIVGKNTLSSKIKNDRMGVQSVIAQKEIDTLFIGASGFRKGIDMKGFEENTPGNTFMLTYNGNEALNMLIELNEIYSAGTNIKNIVIDFNPSMADRGADLSDKRLLWDIGIQGKLELWNKISKEEETSLFTWYDYWILSNNDYLITYPISYPIISNRYYRGGIDPEDNEEGVTKQILDEMPVSENSGINDLQKNSLIEIIELCKQHGSNIIFLEIPRYTKMEEDENYKNKSVELKRFLTDKGIKVYTIEDITFDNTRADYYTDLTHMSSMGRKMFTKELINILSNGAK